MKTQFKNGITTLFAILIAGAVVSCSKEAGNLVDDTEQGTGLTGGSRNPNEHASGAVTALFGTGPETVEFSATVTNGGVNGTVHAEGPYGEIGGEVVCLVVDGNRATIGFLITEATGVEYLLGYIGYNLVMDNGEGSNSDPDQVHQGFYTSESVDCETYCPTCEAWELAGTFFDVVEGNIQVNEGN